MTALLEYLIWITHPHTIITERKNTLLQSHQPRLSYTEFNKDRFYQPQVAHTKNLTLSVILYGFLSVMAFLARRNGPVWAVSIRKQNQK